MQTEWLTDFLTLSQTRSFSRAAQLRHITQPAFSRRIRALENWAEATLVERGRQPLLFTPAGQELLKKIPELTEALRRTHALLAARAPSHRGTLAFAASPSLASGFFPAWITSLASALEGAGTRLTVLEPCAGLQHLLDGGCDLLLAHAGNDLPGAREADDCEFLSLDHERLLPCSRPQACGAPTHALSRHSSQPQAYLAHATDTALARAIESALRRQPQAAQLQRVFESDSLETLKAMALAGAGIAILPEQYMRAELDQGLLVQAGDDLDMVLEVRLLRRRPAPGSVQETAAHRFWNHLHAGPGGQFNAVAANGAAAGLRRTRPEMAEVS
ncbi:MAG: LysR family transcriptional regulator [Hydrogenophaga sp.]|uniref:LysR family transcriptional regulator n=1 Tax=Hydrogenophaga sp. TaxID=1904254 RepID=UPI003D0C44FE